MAGFTHLFIPGPTNIPEQVRQAMNLPMEDMRAATFPDLTLPLFEDIKSVFKNETGRVFIYPSSGTGAWEAAMTNVLSPGDRVLMSRFGQFSHLWVDMAERLGFEVDVIDCEWGTGVPLDLYAERLKADKTHRIKAIFCTQNETATGVTSDVAGCRAALDDANHPALLFVDGVSSIGSIDFRQEEWGVDCAVSGSQKGFMLPAGLGFLSVSKKALVASRTATHQRCFFSFEDMIRANDAGYFPYTPATQLLRGLRASLDLIEDEGLDAIFARHHRLAEGVRKAVDAWGLKLCAKAPKWHSDTVSAILVPDGIDSGDVVKRAYQAYQTSLGGGLNKVFGKVFRIGHLGWLNEVMVLASLSSAEMALLDCGVRLAPGSGVGAAIQHFRASAAMPVAEAA
ncbi:aminotransferase class V-fold PLP-dependent enzyme [Mesorhizobium sp. B2-5-4]|uniref:aminotransferase class V-fold PLP-dependent enzyme n=1 Tax=unclassified Mesorhizobium TaxID=325217 RepID=UPI00112D0E8F|nr:MULTISPECIES: aminotransferase class V-fold PLP-dependent enzyme [unclassified Mesorhizobium]TPJ41058.1 aminotransferase class V-fold PLP-dependent enzyme [Mesorhizobium sp. B2-6-5]TPJ86998.1 aminotransferase class V-fold PLP-dependent enzyme [Mesorhizobium sp. B2-5-13]TPK47623.1 aminotransferase class V-fold PLP-dependent enzyme [Mesorhizobium sp. B2-5-4]TPK51773.1 aminotransferase class V-fold PLP-dependent enzyme [Mesorhizobium sp. B2-5-5]TPL90767.1 aminotransferase class V-fold PLP-depe